MADRIRFRLNPLRPNRTRFMATRHFKLGRFNVNAYHYNNVKEWAAHGISDERRKGIILCICFVDLELTVTRK